MTEVHLEENCEAFGSSTLCQKPRASWKKKLIISFLTLACLAGGVYKLAEAYKESANQAACIINISSVQKTIHSYH